MPHGWTFPTARKDGHVPIPCQVAVGTIVYRWDSNIRQSTVPGFVGTGGIGIQLYASVDRITRLKLNQT
jgi:ABC-type phosphate/phosphonate transport system permease subunit